MSPTFEPLEPRLLLDGVPVCQLPAGENLFVPCDLNYDTRVDGADLAVWQQHYDPLGIADRTYFQSDLNCDGRVDGADLALWQRNYDSVGTPSTREYAKFNDYCTQYFNAETEELVYETFGDDLVFDAEGSWEHASVNSATIAFGTNLPARTYVAFGETEDHGQMTVLTERGFYTHVHYVTGLQAGTEYHYRLVAMDERGNVITGEDRTFTTQTLAGKTRTY